MLRLKAILLYILAFLLLIAPMGYIIYYRRDIYFQETSATKVTVGLLVAIAFTLFIILKGFGSLNKDFKTLISLGVMTGIIALLDVFIKDIVLIMPALFVGWAMFIVPKWIAMRYWDKANIHANQYIIEDVKREVRKEFYDDGSAWERRQTNEGL